MILKDNIINKCFYNGKLKYKYKNTKYIQKNFTEEEIIFINSLSGNNFLEKLTSLCETHSNNSNHEYIKLNKTYYEYNGIKIFSAKELYILIGKEIEKEKNLTNVFDYRDLVWKTFGKNYIKKFQIKKQKRKVILIKSINELQNLYEYRNNNIKYMFSCLKCKKTIITSFNNIIKSNLICKNCR